MDPGCSQISDDPLFQTGLGLDRREEIDQRMVEPLGLTQFIGAFAAASDVGFDADPLIRA
jgi:hypothetical protein